MASLDRRLQALQRDYTEETGLPFKHFACPITLSDVPGRLCLGHVVNAAFPGSSKRRLVQRADVDNFFGSVFESLFVKLRHKGRHRLEKYLTDPALGKDLPPRFLLKGEEIGHYFTTGEVAPGHTAIPLPDQSQSRKLVLKIHPERLAALGKARFDFGVDADLRVPAFVSLLKAAHLTLFDLLGYRHALSLAGRFLGKDLLGALFLRHRGRPKRAVLADSWSELRSYASLVRPLLNQPTAFRGTISDGKVLVCRSSGSVLWGLVVLVRTGRTMHGVMTPVFDTAPAAGRFFEFLTSNGQHFEAAVGLYKGGAWHISRDWSMFQWPPTDLPG